ncbi:hypothetical protein EVAR_92227_1 [Eumeta japonica]|uniref:Uncharacterized protein n=1 Tax=Eumeta variegata TaxID=151549 RepID=A0A4C1TL47_EUMVA|nr:hypothetical protein EVAR_92227_1 [Eumeta japonica]
MEVSLKVREAYWATFRLPLALCKSELGLVAELELKDGYRPKFRKGPESQSNEGTGSKLGTGLGGGARRRRRRRPPTASRLKGPRKQKSLLLKRGLAKSFAYKLLKKEASQT